MWYELEGCIDVLVYYMLQDNGNVQVCNWCWMDGEVEEVIGEVSVIGDDSVWLVVSFLFKGLCWLLFIKGDYWVIQIVLDYSVLLVGSLDCKFFWLFLCMLMLDCIVQDYYLVCVC